MTIYDQQVAQLFRGVTWEGNLINQSARDKLVADGLAFVVAECSALTPRGVRYVLDNNLVDPPVPPMRYNGP